MYEFHPYFTNDGSVGLYNPDFNDIYHSASGALTEAYEKFILPIDFETLLQKNEINVLDICYGIGYNSKSFLNFIFEKIFSEKFSKNNLIYKNNIATIHTNNIFDKISRKFKKYKRDNNTCNDSIYTDNIFSKISITAIDNDEILSLISPFVKTGVKNTKNQNLDFDYKIIDKYLKSEINNSDIRIQPIINFLIFEKIIADFPQIFDNVTFNEILNNKKYESFFDSQIRSIYNFYRNKTYRTNPNLNKLTFLHNIYYRYLSNCYKNDLKTYKLQDIDFSIKIRDARDVIKNDNKKYDLIFLDAFTPSKCPCLWSYEFFLQLYEHLNEDGLILTYSSSAAIRSAMLEAKFFVGKIYNANENKFTGTIASKNKSKIKFNLSEDDLSLIKTTAGIFYRDKNLTGLNEAIIKNRNQEIKKSTRISSSQYFKAKKEKECTTM